MTVSSLLRRAAAGTGAAFFLALGLAGGARAADTPVGATTLGGKLFLDVSHLNAYRNGQRTATSRDGADLKRFYLDLDHRFTDVWSAHLTTDINWARDSSPTDLWLKHAYLQGAFSKALVLRFGSAPLPWAGFVNQWSGYRYVDKELVTRLKFGASADWGVHALGALGDGGRLQYAASVISGSSFKHPRTGDRPDVEARVAWQPSAHSVLAVGGYDGERALGGGNLPTYHTARRWDAMAAYATQRVRLGAQYFRAVDWNQVRSPRGDRASGWSAWASVVLDPRWAVFARYDRADTSASLDPSRRDHYANLGVAYRVSRQVQLAAVYKRERISHEHLALSSSNELGVYAQIGF
ncbi:porin [Dyella sp. KULCS107]|uniref:porin n=1 Tax=Dyella sp. KULCS107 TaxID=3422216 RepID=UPI003D6FF27C